MDYRRLGNSGLVVSSVGLGCNNMGGVLNAAATRDVVGAAIDAGITFFDTADVYNAGRSEEYLGAALHGHRNHAIVATKFGGEQDLGYGPAAGSRGSRQYLRHAVEMSLKRLGTDWIDLLQLHRPDLNTPIAETLSALNELIRDGKVRYISCCGFASWQLVQAVHVASELGLQPFISVQREWSLLNRLIEAEMVPAATHYGVAIIPSFPLASGLLTGKVVDGLPPAGSRLAGWASHFVTPDRLAKTQKIEFWARQQGISILEVAFGWLLAQPAVSCVAAGATSPEQVRANVQAAAWKPTAAQTTELGQI